ncbi:MAG: pyridoxamine 5'-phosphate oxidase family protein [Cyanobacteria bacterium P01_D01_bin.1]
MTSQITKTPKTKIKRVPKRGRYDFDSIAKILDEGLVCQVGFALDNQPFVIPTAYARVEDCVYIHGAGASRLVKTLQTGVDVCFTVTLLDGLVLARSAYHHSMNYRSVVLFGQAQTLTDAKEKITALKAFTEHVLEGRWDQVRSPNPQELAETCVLKLPIIEASAKIRMGPPVDAEADYSLPVWAGVLPLSSTADEPIPDPRLLEDQPLPDNIRTYARSGWSLGR